MIYRKLQKTILCLQKRVMSFSTRPISIQKFYLYAMSATAEIAACRFDIRAKSKFNRNIHLVPSPDICICK